MRSFVFFCAALAGTYAGTLASASADPSSAGVDALLARSKAALGGDAIVAVHAVRVQSSLTFGGIQGKQDAWQDFSGSRYAETLDAGPLSGADGFDGREYWQMDASGVVHDEGATEPRIVAIDTAYMNGFALWLPDHGGAAVDDGGLRTANAVDYHVLRVTPRGGSALDVW